VRQNNRTDGRQRRDGRPALRACDLGAARRYDVPRGHAFGRRTPGSDATANEFFENGIDLGEIEPAARRTLVVKFVVEAREGRHHPRAALERGSRGGAGTARDSAEPRSGGTNC
jgi:hypothetical protein